jgi:hypothetical protein
VPVYQVQGPEFKPWQCQKINKINKKLFEGYWVEIRLFSACFFESTAYIKMTAKRSRHTE